MSDDHHIEETGDSSDENSDSVTRDDEVGEPEGVALIPSFLTVDEPSNQEDHDSSATSEERAGQSEDESKESATQEYPLEEPALSEVHLPEDSDTSGERGILTLTKPFIESLTTETKVRVEAEPGHVESSDRDAYKLAFVGGRQVGKTYLFQALVKSMVDAENSGALSYFINVDDPVELYRKHEGSSSFVDESVSRYLRSYNAWERLKATQLGNQDSFQLRVPIRSGVLGRDKRSLVIEYFDGAGELMSSETAQARKSWIKHYRDAEVMVFCLPIWAAFPTPDHMDIAPKPDEHRKDLKEAIKSFESVVRHYNNVYKREKLTTRVKCIIALTQADQVEYTTVGQRLADTWMYPFRFHSEITEVEFESSVEKYKSKLATGAGVNRYLKNARDLSDLLRQELKSNKNINHLLKYLDYGAGEPWLIPMSAIDGNTLEQAMDGRRPGYSPVPAHVELPLLVALSQYCNALM